MAGSVWLISALIGLAAGLYGVLEARRDLRALGKATNGRRLVARERLIAQLVRGSISGLWALVGIGLLWDGRLLEVPLSATVLVLEYGNIALTALTLMDVYVGRRLRRP